MNFLAYTNRLFSYGLCILTEVARCLSRYSTVNVEYQNGQRLLKIAGTLFLADLPKNPTASAMYAMDIHTLKCDMLYRRPSTMAPSATRLVLYTQALYECILVTTLAYWN